MTLLAKDASEINTLGIGVSAAGGGAFGAALAVNAITNTLTTKVDKTDLNTLGALSLTSHSAAVIRSLALGASGSGTIAVQMTALENVIANKVLATISGSTVVATNDVTLSAKDVAPVPNSFMDAISGYLPDDDADPDAAADSEAANSSQDNLDETISDSGLTFDPNANVVSVLIGVAGSGGVAINGTLSENRIANEITATIADADVTSDNGDIVVDAQSQAGITSLTAGVRVAGGVALNALVANNTIGKRH